MMKKLLFLLLWITNSYAGFLAPYDPSQSSPSYNWSQMNNDYVQVIYPSFLEDQANFIANLVEHYSTVTGLSYGITRPKKFPLIIRNQFAVPNGFVTLAPRRSEWYTSSIFTPILGGLNFYQSLAIHEYRHINQFDSMYRSTNKFAYALFGDFGLSLAIGMGVPAWFLEGDAVWSETRFSDAGRGRSPRFAARLKAMVLTDQIPTYDEFIGGTYRTLRPNHYVFGYFLVTQGYKLYGDEVWGKVLDSVTGFSFNPYALTNAFESITGEDFEKFYNQTMTDLKFAWRKDAIIKTNDEFVEHQYPIVDQGQLYYLKKDLNSFWGLYKYGISKPIKELDISPSISRVDLKNDLFVYTQFLPSARFAYKNYHDLFSYNLKTKETKHLIKDSRIYQPQISPNKDRILAVKFREDNSWGLTVVDLNGNEEQFIGFKDEIISEAVWFDNSTVMAIVQMIDGRKVIKAINLQTKRSRSLTNPTRNNLYSLHNHQGLLYFEADINGSVQILRLQPTQTGYNLSTCSDEPIAAYNPFVSGKKLYFVTELDHGKQLKSRELNCKNIENSTIEDFNYLGKSPSDNFIETMPLEFTSFNNVVSKKNTPTPYEETSTGLSPHSWSFISGRGIEASVSGNNYLNTFAYQLGVGQSAEEKQPFGYGALYYTKYYPIFSISADYRKREDTDSRTNLTSNWAETELKFNTTLPFSFKSGLYYNHFELTGSLGQIEFTEDITARSYELSDDSLEIQAAEVLIYSLKEKRFREIFPSYGFLYNAVAKKAQAKKVNSFSSDVLYQNLNIYLPGFFKNNGFKLSAFRERQTKGFNNYRFNPINDAATEYVFSRGFDYTYVDRYTKGSIEYATPLWNTDFDLAGWVYLRRIFAKAYFDHTKVELLNFTNNLNSAGAELIFETKFFRLLDLNLGVRNNNKLDRNESSFDFFIGTDLSL
ncbi:MAG: hypothetical protein COW01_16260 [Bdellovibrionales bacterium CG12_big_fil_rev_8_21_14_0_65_38_15]|nr:MAG: hypothetical protein COW79_00650 [Bdellovibrionales bacterium CG22_combo_CG10-13_8_21_14_all_38_13]PIQ52257.1 MAG: hypothetical protein COW01_16260 [Bdellovibrionales bacterium CG12_big_fil_rev_8_21_14_0_65_38_15]PIR29786.1 MAG: hypothetical protein COV38_08725 [Bdellovibrionales bacterium CG11_big_fil_rev_8_21_14_0_20_38_13]